MQNRFISDPGQIREFPGRIKERSARRKSILFGPAAPPAAAQSEKYHDSQSQRDAERVNGNETGAARLR